MAHNIHRRLDGTFQALYVGQPAWHGLGEVVADAQTAEQIYRRVYRKRVIELAPAYTRIGRKLIEVPETRFTVDRATQTVFAPVSADYQPIQDIDPLRMLMALVKASRRKAGFVSAFSLGNGARNAATLDLTRVLGEKALTVLRDQSQLEAFLVADWAHDGSGALRIMDAINRVDCNNMLTAANTRAENKGTLVRIIHSGSDQTLAAQMEEAERILGLATREVKASVKMLNQLAEIALPKPDPWFAGFVELLVPIPEEMERKATRTETRELLTALWQDSKTLVGVPKSPYRALQVVAEYGDHFRGLRVSKDNAAIVPEKRFRSITEGPSAQLKAHALELIRQEFEVKVPVAR